jgi:hypothetical protein
VTPAILEKLTGFRWEAEYRFAAEYVGMGEGVRARLDEAGLQDWRFDFACPELHLAVEIEGGGWTGGRHTRGLVFAHDLRKYQAAMRMQWDVYRCDHAMVKSGEAYETIGILVGMKR